MNQPLRPLVAALGLALTAATASAQYDPVAPAAAKPSAGYFNDWLRSQDSAFAPWDLGLNLRLRYQDEEHAGFDYSGSNADFRTGGSLAGAPVINNNYFFLDRIMPHVGYTGQDWSFLLEGRSSGTFGDDRGAQVIAADAKKPGRNLNENDRQLQVFQGWVLAGDPAHDAFSLKVGRQILNYGDQRLLGQFDWNNEERSYDAIKAHWQTSFFGVDFFTGGVVYKGNDNEYDRSHVDHDLLSGAYFIFTTPVHLPVVETYFLAHNVNAGSALVDVDANGNPDEGVPSPFRNPPKQDLYTVGVHVKSKPADGPWDYGAELMHQFGDLANRNAAGVPFSPLASSATVFNAVRERQDANAAVVQGGYTWRDAPWQPHLELTFSYGSGGKGNGGTSETFQMLYPTTHLFYGYMDLNTMQNLEDFRVTYSIQPLKDVTVALDVHFQYLASTQDAWYNVAGVARTGGTPIAGTPNVVPGTGYGINPTLSGELGQEVDLVAAWQATKTMKIEVGISHYFIGSYIKGSLANLGSRDADFH